MGSNDRPVENIRKLAEALTEAHKEGPGKSIERIDPGRKLRKDRIRPDIVLDPVKLLRESPHPLRDHRCRDLKVKQ